MLRCVVLARLALRGVLAGVMRDVGLVSLAAVLGLAGFGFLLAAGFGLLADFLGVIAALALTGVGLLLLAGLVLLLRRKEPVVVVVSAPAANPVSDPVAQMVFDLSFRLGRELTRRKD